MPADERGRQWTSVHTPQNLPKDQRGSLPKTLKSLILLALPREAREVSKFNDLPKGLGESCLTDLQEVSEGSPNLRREPARSPISLSIPETCQPRHARCAI